MWFGAVSIFPEMFRALEFGVTGRAIKEKLIELHCWNPRDFSTDKHQSVDDRPYGGGPGMVMMAEPLQAAIQAAKKAASGKATVIYLSPQGRLFNQDAAAEFTSREALIFVSGRYEGIDERVIQQEIDEEWSVGDYILTGGELAAMTMMDTITRLIPGVVGDQDSIEQDSITTGLLKYSQYTRPEIALNSAVPDILLSGHHQQIENYRLKESLGKTWLRRPELLTKKNLSEQEFSLLTEFIEEFLLKSARKTI